MDVLNYLSALFNVTLTQTGRGEFACSRKIDVTEFEQAVKEGHLKWQDPNAYDCGNADGWFYVFVDDTDIGYDPEADRLYLS